MTSFVLSRAETVERKNAIKGCDRSRQKKAKNRKILTEINTFVVVAVAERFSDGIVFGNNPTDLFGLGRISCDVFTFPHPVFKQNRFTESARVWDRQKSRAHLIEGFGQSSIINLFDCI